MEWEMESCVTFFFIVWFCLELLDVMKVVGINLIQNIVAFSLIKFYFHLSFIGMLVRNPMMLTCEQVNLNK